MPTKPVRITLQPVQAIALYTALDTLCLALQPAAKTPQHHELLDTLGEIQATLLDKLEVSFL
jgi:hypothetical protein